jgi:hypothetical protein
MPQLPQRLASPGFLRKPQSMQRRVSALADFFFHFGTLAPQPSQKAGGVAPKGMPQRSQRVGPTAGAVG